MIVAEIDCPWGGKLQFSEHSPLDYAVYQVFGKADDNLEQYVGLIRKTAARMWFKVKITEKI